MKPNIYNFKSLGSNRPNSTSIETILEQERRILEIISDLELSHTETYEDKSTLTLPKDTKGNSDIKTIDRSKIYKKEDINAHIFSHIAVCNNPFYEGRQLHVEFSSNNPNNEYKLAIEKIRQVFC